MALWAPLWGRGLLLPDLIAVEASLRAAPWAQRRQEDFVLVAAGDDKAVLASCEIYEIPAEFDGTAVCVVLVASLFVEPALRRHGYARELLEGVAAAAERRPGCVAVLLFSDIGTGYYERLGFRALCGAAPADIVLPSLASAVPGVELVSAFGGLDERALNAAMPAAAPDLLALPVELERAELVTIAEASEAARRGRSPPAHRGARGEEGGEIAWLADYEEGELVVLVLSARSPHEAAALLAAAQGEAAAAGLTKGVRLWDMPQPLAGGDATAVATGGGAAAATAAAATVYGAEVDGAVRVPRTGKIPMVRALGGGEAVERLFVQRISWG